MRLLTLKRVGRNRLTNSVSRTQLRSEVARDRRQEIQNEPIVPQGSHAEDRLTLVASQYSFIACRHATRGQPVQLAAAAAPPSSRRCNTAQIETETDLGTDYNLLFEKLLQLLYESLIID